MYEIDGEAMSSEDLLKRLHDAGGRIDHALGRLEKAVPSAGLDEAGLNKDVQLNRSAQWQHSRQAIRERLDTAIERLEKILG